MQETLDEMRDLNDVILSNFTLSEQMSGGKERGMFKIWLLGPPMYISFG